MADQIKVPGSLVNKFMKLVSSGASSVTVTDIDTSPLYIQGVLQKDGSPGETLYHFFAQVELFGMKLGAASGDAQAFDSDFRVIGNDPIMYYKTVA
jgi:hypothetical protein